MKRKVIIIIAAVCLALVCGSLICDKKINFVKKATDAIEDVLKQKS